MSTELSDNDIAVLKLLGDSFLKIRALTCKSLHPNLSEKEALELIYALADASHNLPEILATGGEKSHISFLLESSVSELKNTLGKAKL